MADTRDNPSSQAGRITGAMPPGGQIRRMIQLSFAKSVKIAWRNIRVRAGRSILVVSGIVLAVAFLTYVMCSEVLASHLARVGDSRLVDRLREDGFLGGLDDSDSRVQTWWLVALALAVSFVSILNSILLSVTERFREIGTMKCLGALDSLIVRLFLLESLFQGLFGTVLGVVAGLALVIAEGLSAGGGAILPYVPYARLAGLAGLCIACGTVLTVIGAIYPTWRAARMKPVDAMRLEI